MPFVLAVLKVLAIFLLLVAVLVIVALLLPLGFAVEYRPGRFRVSAVYGPFRRTIWAHRTRSRAASAAREKPAVSQRGSAADSSTASDTPTPKAAPVTPEAEAAPPPVAGQPAPGEPGTAPEPLLPEEEEEALPEGAMGRLERMLILLEEDPRKLGNCVLGHMRWLHRHSFFKMSIRQVDIFWTVTCEDAAATATVYGAEMAAFNTALALVQQTVRLKCKRLWLEPDFTGARRAERKIACVVSASAILMIHLLYRIWKDPLLQPAQQTDSQTT